MPDEDAAPMPDEDLLRQTREIRDKLKPCAASFCGAGLEVDSFLEECDRFIAFLEGRSEDWEDVNVFVEKLTAFASELSAYANIQREAERINAVASIPGMLDAVENLAKQMDNPKDASTIAALKESTEAARKRLAGGEVPWEELQDISISSNAQMGALKRRMNYHSAALALFWESRPPEWWAKLNEEARKDLEKLLAQWRGEREKILGELPIADRRRLEALRPEDFDKPGVFEA